MSEFAKATFLSIKEMYKLRLDKNYIELIKKMMAQYDLIKK